MKELKPLRKLRTAADNVKQVITEDSSITTPADRELAVRVIQESERMISEMAKEYFVDVAKEIPVLPVWHMANTIPVYSYQSLADAGVIFKKEDEWKEPDYIVMDYRMDIDEWVFKFRHSKVIREHTEFSSMIGYQLSAEWDADEHGWRFPAVMYNARLILEKLEAGAKFYSRYKDQTWEGKPSRYQEMYRYCSRVGITPLAKQMMEVKQAQESRWEALVDNQGISVSATDFCPSKPLLKTQINGIEFLIAHDAVCGDDMGTGKTRIGLNVAWYLFNLKDMGVNRCVVVCPATVTEVWKNQAREYFTHHMIPMVIRGTWDMRLRQLRAVYPQKRTDEDGTEFRPMPLYIVSYETAKLHPVEMQTLCDDGLLLLDEAHKIKASDSQTAQFIHSLRPIAVKELTGTPIMNVPMDAYSIMDRVKKGIVGRSPNEFFLYFAKAGDRYKIEYRRLGELNARIRPWFLRRLKKDVIDLPEKMWLRDYETLPMGPIQRKAYKDLAEKYIMELETMEDESYIVQASNVMTRILRLMQICDGYKTDGVEGGHIEWISDAVKPKQLREILKDNLTGNERKVVIWSRFLPPLKMMATELAEYHPVVLHGGVPMEKRGSGPMSSPDTVVGRFHHDPKCRVFLGQIQTGGQGIDLTCADLCIFYDHWWAPGMNEQAEDRQHRIGQRNPVTIIPLVVDNSIDQYYFGYEFEVNGEAEQGLLYHKKAWKAEAVDGGQSFMPSRQQLIEWLRRA